MHPIARILVFAGATYATTWVVHRYVNEKIAAPDVAGIALGAVVGVTLDRYMQKQKG